MRQQAPTASERSHALELLRRGEWFSRMPLDLQERVLGHATLHDFATGRSLSRMGEVVPGLWIVLQGQVLLRKLYADGTEFFLHVGGPGFWFSAAETLTGDSSAYDGIAATRVRAMLLSRQSFRRIVHDTPAYYAYFAEPTLKRYLLMMNLFAQSHTLTPERFIRMRLALLVALWRQDGYAEPVIEVALSQAKLARLFGTSRQTLNRHLAQLQDEGVIETSFRSVRILEVESTDAFTELRDAL